MRGNKMKMGDFKLATMGDDGGKELLSYFNTEPNPDVRIGIKKLVPNAQMPVYSTKGAAGFDIYTTEAVLVKPGATNLVPTGIAMSIPKGYEVQIRARSGIALKTPLRLANGIGTIDCDFTGEVKIIVENTSDEGYFIEPGTRIAQGVVNKLPLAELVEVKKLSETERGEGGFGSTGIK